MFEIIDDYERDLVELSFSPEVLQAIKKFETTLVSEVSKDDLRELLSTTSDGENKLTPESALRSLKSIMRQRANIKINNSTRNYSDM